ncbi:Brix-domain-containing protein [Pisolithus microcarpus]|nr:Brix-domain-containing protein [Pisolithus microcarpus]
MLRRQARERRQYIYAKSLEAQERHTYERKRQLKDALASGKQLPTELRKDVKALGKDLAFDEAQQEPSTHIDNEYSRAGTYDPKLVNNDVKGPYDACRANDVTDLVILHEHRGVPDAMIVSHFPHGPTVYFTLHNVTLRHDVDSYKTSTVSEQYPHLIFEQFTSKLGVRIQDILKYLFPVPKEDSKRVMTFANEDDFISFRVRDTNGTVDQTEAEREWVLAHYSRTAKKRRLLSSVTDG